MNKTIMKFEKTDAGVVLNGFIMQPIIDNCLGCERSQEFEGATYCSSYALPSSKWTMGICNFATHVKTEATKAAKVNPLKASKRSVGKK